MSGEAVGSAVGVGLLLAAGGALFAAALTAGVVTAASYAGYHAIKGTGRFALSSIDKRRQKMLNTIKQEIGALEFDYSFSAEEISYEMEDMYKSRAEAINKLKGVFDSDKEEGALERFFREMNKQNTSIIEGVNNQKEMLIRKYEEKIGAELESIIRAIKENGNQVESRLDKIQSEFKNHEEKTKNEAWKVYIVASMLLEQLQEEYTEVKDICPIELKSIEEDLIYSKERLEDNSFNSYEYIIAICGELPRKIIECMNKCDKYRIGQCVYINAADKMLSEIQKFLETQRVVEYKKSGGNSSEGIEEVYECEISQFMKGKYEAILEAVDKYYLKLEEKSNINEMELIDIYNEICKLHTDTMNEVVKGMERIRSYFMRSDIVNEVVNDLVTQGYLLKDHHIDMEAGTILVNLMNNETGNIVSVVISESDYINYIGQIELVNDIRINHISDKPLTDETEEERLDIRKKVMRSINTSKNLADNYGHLRCDIVCKAESYMKNPFLKEVD